MKLKYKLWLAIAPSIFILDQITKMMIVKWIKLGSRHPVIEGFFDIVHYRNSGAAFGLLADTADGFRVPFFYAIATVAVFLLTLFYRSLKDDEVLMPTVLSLVFGGIAGNITDRIRFGMVVDFLSVHMGNASLDFNVLDRYFHVPLEWPAFNVADSAISVAMLLLLYSAFRRRPTIPPPL